MFPKVCVLMSTYNGQEYVRQQIESVLAQKNVDVTLVVRDDGSTDETIKIIQEINSDKIILYEGKNIKPAKSFMQLVKIAPNSDYYAFCDQDDVWHEDKLQRAVEKLSRTVDKEALYMSTYDVVDSELNYRYKRDMEYHRPFTVAQTIVFRAPSGCVMVFNRKMRELLNLHNVECIRMHDFLTLLLAESFHADLYYDDISTMKYRQHGNNMVGTGISVFSRVTRLVNSALFDKRIRYEQAMSVYNSYHDEMPCDTIKTYEKVDGYYKKFQSRFRLAFDREFRWNKKIDLLFRISVVLGVF